MLTNSITYNEEEDEDECISNFRIEILSLLQQLNPRENTPNRIKNYFEITIPRYTHKEFQSHFRLSKESYDSLLFMILPIIRSNDRGRNVQNVEKDLLAVIWLLGTPDSYRSVGDRFDMGKASLSDAFMRTIRALNIIGPNVISWPRNGNIERIQQGFERFVGMRNVLGAIDGTFAPIKAPKLHPEVYITRKCNYAMNLQCIAEPSRKFTDSYIAYPGSVGDARVFRSSHIYRDISADTNTYIPPNSYIIGDKAYPLLPWCQVIERAFSLLFGRFRRLKYLDMNNVEMIPLSHCMLYST